MDILFTHTTPGAGVGRGAGKWGFRRFRQAVSFLPMMCIRTHASSSGCAAAPGSSETLCMLQWHTESIRHLFKVVGSLFEMFCLIKR